MGLKLLCDHVSAGEKSLKLPSSGAKSVPPPPLLWVEATVHLKSRNWPRSLCWHALGGIRLEGVKIYNCKRCTSSLILKFPPPGCINFWDDEILGSGDIFSRQGLFFMFVPKLEAELEQHHCGGASPAPR